MLYFSPTYRIQIHLKRRDLCLKKAENVLTLAWTLLSKCCARIVKSLKKVLYSEDFAARHKTAPEAFTRNRKLPFTTLICLLTNFVKSSYQNELDHFFKALGQLQVAKRIVTKPALTQARKKLKHEAFIELNQHLIHRAEEQLRLKRWHGLRLVGIDGTTCRLPRIDEISEHFGVWNVRKGAPCPSARISQLFDTLNKLSISAVITPKNIDEREHAYELFHNLLPGDLVLMDRGYPAFWLFKVIFSMQAGFCARISDQWKIVRDFLSSGLPDQLVELEPSISSIKICKERNLCTKPMTVRLVRVELDSGETEVLITSLTDSKRYKTKDFKRLYHCRWPIEEDYKTMKCWIELNVI